MKKKTNISKYENTDKSDIRHKKTTPRNTHKKKRHEKMPPKNEEQGRGNAHLIL
jgi:hypothetical protein